MTNPLETPQARSSKKFERLLLVTAAMIYLLITVGGIVRVTGSGLGCPDWPTCYGKWIPPLRIDAILEYSHRLIATLTSPLILASAVIGWLYYRKQKWIVNTLVIAGGLLVIQALLGGIVVLLETPPDLVAVHLGTALLILALILLCWLIIHVKGADIFTPVAWDFQTPYKKLSWQSLVLLFIALMSGAIVAGSGSTYACGGWPLCNGQLIPASSWGWIHMIHRAVVLLSSVWIVRAWAAIRKQNENPNVVPLSNWMLALFAAQVAVGAFKVTTGFAIWLLGLHVAFASATWAIHFLVTGFAGIVKLES